MKIVRQRDEKDCGVCSLLSIIRHYKGDVPLEVLRLDAGVTNKGTTALSLLLVGRKYGFDTQGLKLNNLNELKQLPAIGHMNLKNGLSHYVVIYRYTKDKVYIMDSSKGKVVLSLEEFYRLWSKIVLVFYSKRKITVLKKNNTLKSIFFRILKSERKLIIMISFFSILLILFTIAFGYFFQVMINSINKSYPINYLKLLILLFGSILVFKIFLKYFRSIFETYLNKNVDALLMDDFLNHLYNLPLRVITSRQAGEIVTRVNELMGVKSIITDLFITSSLDLTITLFIIPLLINISSNLFVLLICAFFLYLCVGVITANIIYKKAYQNISYETEFNSTLLEDIKMFTSLKNLNLNQRFLKKTKNKLSLFLYDTFQLNLFLNRELLIKDIIYEIGLFVIMGWGCFLVYKKTINFSELVTFNTLLGYSFEPLKNIINSLPKYGFLKATITKLNDFLSINKEVENCGMKLSDFDVEVRNLSVSYNKYHKLFSNLNFLITKGEFIHLKGASGSGKSTLCNILMKYYEEYDGSIWIGNMNLKDINRATILKNIVYVSQNESLYTGTIKENIMMERIVDNEKFNEVCKICAIENIVDKKPLRYDSGISNEDNNISGGEKRRIILARALLKDFNILLLDEALNEVDKDLELKIIDNIKKKYKEKIIIYISHKDYPNIFNKTIDIGALA